MRNLTLLWLISLIPVIVIVGIPLFWCFVIWLISIISGWHRLAQRYRATQPATGKKWVSQYGYVNGGRYGNVLNITTNAEGIFLETITLFSFNHPRLFIPWRDLHNPTPVTARYRNFYQVEIGNPATDTLRLPIEVFEQSEGRRLLQAARIGTNVPN